MKKIIIIVLLVGLLVSGYFFTAKAATDIGRRLKGRLLLDVDQGGAIYYVDDQEHKRHQVKWDNALPIFEKYALGITDEGLLKIPVSLDSINPNLDSDNDGYKDISELKYGYSPYIPGDFKGKFQIDQNFANRLRNKFLLQVNQGGAIWYVDEDGIRHNVRWDNLMPLFESLALGITHNNLEKIYEGDLSGVNDNNVDGNNNEDNEQNMVGSNLSGERIDQIRDAQVALEKYYKINNRYPERWNDSDRWGKGWINWCYDALDSEKGWFNDYDEDNDANILNWDFPCFSYYASDDGSYYIILFSDEFPNGEDNKHYYTDEYYDYGHYYASPKGIFYLNENGPNKNELDSDGDGLSDNKEIRAWRTNPNNSDTDNDDYSDGYEVNNHFDPLVFGKEEFNVDKPKDILIENLEGYNFVKLYEDVFNFSDIDPDKVYEAEYGHFMNNYDLHVVIDKYKNKEDTISALDTENWARNEDNTFTLSPNYIKWLSGNYIVLFQIDPYNMSEKHQSIINAYKQKYPPEEVN